jgi:hypothetical protein
MRSRLVNILTYTVLFFWVLVCIFPFYWVAVTSLKGEREIGGGPFYLPFLDFMPTLDAWKYLLVDSNDNLLLRYLNSAVVGLTATSLTVLLAGTAIYGLTRFRFALRWTALALGLLLAALVLNLFFVSKIGPQFSFAIAFVLFLFLALRLHRHGPALHKHGILIALVATRILPPGTAYLSDGPLHGHAGYALRSHFHLHGGKFTRCHLAFAACLGLGRHRAGGSSADRRRVALADFLRDRCADGISRHRRCCSIDIRLVLE